MPLPELHLRPDADAPLYRQLGEMLAAAIADGTLAEGERLPSERDLALTLGVSRTTVVTAYRELEARGLVRGHVGRGTFVCAADEPTDAPFAWRGRVALGAQRALDPALRGVLNTVGPGLISFGAGTPAAELFPVDLFRRLSDDVVRRDHASAFGIGPTEGQPSLRRTVAARLNARPEQVLIVAGAQQGLDLVARCLLDPGDTVLIDRPGYLGAVQTFRSAGANLIGWDIERADPDELEDLILRYRPKLFYTNPNGTASKTLGAGLRLGWLVAPPPIVEQLTLVKARGDLFTNGLTQLVLAELLAARAFEEYLIALRREHAARHAALTAALRKRLPTGLMTWRAATGGLYIWSRLRAPTDTMTLLQRAQATGVTFVPGEPFYGDGLGRHELRLCFSAAVPAAIDEGVRRLTAALAASQDALVAGRHALV
jgi:DNA-binding transcriptional MocR family regulator